MADEKLTIQKQQARLTVIGRSYPDENTNSGLGWDITQELIDILINMDIDLPDVDFDDWDDIDVIIGYDDDGKPIMIYVDPITDEIEEWTIDFPIEEIDWPNVDIKTDVIGVQPVIIIEEDGIDPIVWPIELPEDIDIDDWEDIDVTPIVGPDGEFEIEFEDPDTGIDYDLDIGDLDIGGLIDLYDLDWDFDMLVSGLDVNGLDSAAYVDTDLNIHIENCPTSLEVVTDPNTTEYKNGMHINVEGMVVTAKKADGTTWTNARYPNGHIPLGELLINPQVADVATTFAEVEFADYQDEGIGKIGDISSVADGLSEAFMADTAAHTVEGVTIDDSQLSALIGSMSGNRFATLMPGGYIDWGPNTAGFYLDAWGYLFISDEFERDEVTLSETYYGYQWGIYPFKSAGQPIVFSINPARAQRTRRVAYEGIGELNQASSIGADVTKMNSVSVSWLRPCDGSPISGSFIVTVKERSSGNGGR